jgi:hypothetical protein
MGGLKITGRAGSAKGQGTAFESARWPSTTRGAVAVTAPAASLSGRYSTADTLTARPARDLRFLAGSS